MLNFLIFFLGFISCAQSYTDPIPAGSPTVAGNPIVEASPQYDMFDYFFDWLFGDYSEENYDFNNKNVTSK